MSPLKVLPADCVRKLYRDNNYCYAALAREIGVDPRTARRYVERAMASDATIYRYQPHPATTTKHIPADLCPIASAENCEVCEAFKVCTRQGKVL